MKKSLIILTLSLSIISCSQENKSGTTSAANDTVSAGENQSATAQQSSVDTNINKIGTGPETGGKSKGEVLISNSDCLGCHKVNEKLVGPSYMEVAAKYPATEANKELLVSKIINGGSGVWGEIPMAAHPTISKEDAREMVNYIMSLKTN
ncbi:c-type cytochrome [Daejeonella oryzae]|uniref:c-type cytochrome n=1 Tax=Daejeonella oryzae TaxID=1122943 RepID=UPI00041545D4|nr:c-type cytochrome [Daejeonella oryzae]